ncbi:MAG: hypothetical protein JNM80_03500 [Phycisphaerae bacterium]|nr:hypothetical protein [Phycisphaerae bacterium]
MAAWLPAVAQAQPRDPAEAIMQLQSLYPGVRASVHDQRTRLLFGVPMTPGEAPDLAANAFLDAHRDALGVGEFALVRRWAAGVREGRLTVIGYTQRIEGVPVEGSLLRIAVLKGEGGQPCRVAMVAARLAARPPAEPIAVTAAGAATLALAQQGYANLELVGEPEFVVLPAERQGETFRPDAWAWKVPVRFGEGGEGSARLPRSFFISATSGSLLKVRDEFAHAASAPRDSEAPHAALVTDVAGTVRAYATPTNMLPHRPGNPPSLTPIANLRVAAVDNEAAEEYETQTDADGDYTMSIPSSGDVDVETRLGPTNAWGSVRWFVVDCAGDYVPPTTPTALGDVQNTTSPGTADFDFGDEGEYETAAANAAVQSNRCFMFVLSRLDIDVELFPDTLQVFSSTNQVAPGNAFFQLVDSVPSLLFAPGNNNGSSGAWNMCYSSLYPHEWGHYLESQIGLSISDSFSEGFADSFAVIVNDDYVQGRAHQTFSGIDFHIRPDPRTPNCQYPVGSSTPLECKCLAYGGSNHNVGQIVSGVWVRIIEGMKSTYGASTGLENARTLFIAWMLQTAGATDTCNPIDCTTLTEVLVADDDDSNLGNGTPNDALILSAFDSHGVSPCQP